MTNDDKTEAERMAEAESNPIIRAKWLRLAERQRKYVQLFAPLVNQLQKQGAVGASIQEMIANSAPFSAEMIQTLLDALPTFSDARAKESVVRALLAAAEPYNGDALKKCYEETDDEGLKWAVLNTIASAHGKPHSIDDWLLAIRDTPAGETLKRLSRSK